MAFFEDALGRFLNAPLIPGSMSGALPYLRWGGSVRLLRFEARSKGSGAGLADQCVADSAAGGGENKTMKTSTIAGNPGTWDGQCHRSLAGGHNSHLLPNDEGLCSSDGQ
eukprot:EG_transcript_36721